MEEVLEKEEEVKELEYHTISGRFSYPAFRSCL